jgi:hypothetical protein
MVSNNVWARHTPQQLRELAEEWRKEGADEDDAVYLEELADQRPSFCAK